MSNNIELELRGMALGWTLVESPGVDGGAYWLTLDGDYRDYYAPYFEELPEMPHER